MKTLLERAFKKASSLPEEEKEAFAAFIIEELEKEKKWDELYSNSRAALSELAKEALRDYKKGNTDKLDPDKL